MPKGKGYGKRKMANKKKRKIKRIMKASMPKATNPLTRGYSRIALPKLFPIVPKKKKSK